MSYEPCKVKTETAIWELAHKSLFLFWKVCGYKKLVLLLIPTLWKVCGYEKLVLLLIPTLWKVCGYEKLVLLLIPTL